LQRAWKILGNTGTPSSRSSSPEIRFLILRAFARTEISNPALTSFCECILNMLSLETNLHAKLYEKFHANWEVLIRLLKDLDEIARN
jgi:hypothetical protein